MAIWLQQLGAKVRGYALPPPTEPALFREARVASGMESIIGDVRNAGDLRIAMEKFEPEVIIHMAAQPLVRYSYVNPVETFETNVMGTVNVLEIARSCQSVRSIVNVTSDKCYENQEWAWGYRETEPMGGHDPYSSSKGCAELVTTAFRRSFLGPAGVALASARAGNVIGGGDWAEDRLVPDILRGFQRGAIIKIRRPLSVRPWQHVLEPLSGYLLLAENLFEKGVEYAEGWNFGPGDDDARPVEWIVRKMSELWGPNSGWEVQAEPTPHEAGYLKLDCSKARQLLGWKAR